jgi:hypothetical protein
MTTTEAIPPTTNGKTPTKRAKAPAGADSPVQVNLHRISTETLLVPIIGMTPLICHRFSEKAKRQMLDAMQGRKSPKEPKDPAAEYEAAFYKLAANPDGSPGYGMPVTAFKAATISGARYYAQVTMAGLWQSFFFRGERGDDGQMLARIQGEPIMREDFVRVNRSGADLRYRPEFPAWSTTLEVRYVTSMLTRDSVLNLINAGGVGVGIGEWRVEKRGYSGTYEIDEARPVDVVR